MKNNFCLFERLLKVKKNGVFLFGISFLVFEIFTFLYYANEEIDDIIGGSTKTGNIQSVISPEILEQKCTSQKKQNDTYYVVVMATLLAPVSFLSKTKYPHLQSFKVGQKV